MIKNRSSQLIFQSAYCVLGLIGILCSLGVFNADFNDEFLVYYTNLSNYICIGFMLAALISTYKLSRSEGDGYVSLCPTFNFMCVIMIMVTLLVYNILLARDNTVLEYFTSLSNLIMHLILPVMFILHWVIFYEHGKIKPLMPLYSLILPLIYVLFIVIRAQILKGGYDGVLYPYFFLNIDKLGWGGFFGWIAALLFIFAALGYILFALDNIKAIIAHFKK